MSVIIHWERVSNNKGRQGAFFWAHYPQRDAYIMHGAAMGHMRQRVAPAQRDPAWIAEHETQGKEWAIERESLERVWSSSVGMLMLTFLWKACGLWMLRWYTHLSKFRVTSEKNKEGCKRKSIAKKPFFKSAFSLSCLSSPQLYSAAEAAGAHCKVCRKKIDFVLPSIRYRG